MTSPNTSLSNSLLLSFNIIPPVDSSALEHVGGIYVRHKSSTRLFGRFSVTVAVVFDRSLTWLAEVVKIYNCYMALRGVFLTLRL